MVTPVVRMLPSLKGRALMGFTDLQCFVLGLACQKCGPVSGTKLNQNWSTEVVIVVHNWFTEDRNRSYTTEGLVHYSPR